MALTTAGLGWVVGRILTRAKDTAAPPGSGRGGTAEISTLVVAEGMENLELGVLAGIAWCAFAVGISG